MAPPHAAGHPRDSRPAPIVASGFEPGDGSALLVERAPDTANIRDERKTGSAFSLAGMLHAAFRRLRRVGGESGLDRSARSGLSGRDMKLLSPTPGASPIETRAA
jgi:hypothetical protein